MDIDMSATRQQMLETAERLNQQMTDGIPFTWETLEQAQNEKKPFQEAAGGEQAPSYDLEAYERSSIFDD